MLKTQEKLFVLNTGGQCLADGSELIRCSICCNLKTRKEFSFFYCRLLCYFISLRARSLSFRKLTKKFIVSYLPMKTVRFRQ